jgi:hypothetical protein
MSACHIKISFVAQATRHMCAGADAGAQCDRRWRSMRRAHACCDANFSEAHILKRQSFEKDLSSQTETMAHDPKLVPQRSTGYLFEEQYMWHNPGPAVQDRWVGQGRCVEREILWILCHMGQLHAACACICCLCSKAQFWALCCAAGVVGKSFNRWTTSHIFTINRLHAIAP